MKIAIITSGILPVPAVRGGAVENLIDFNLEYNEIHKEHDITVYSIFDETVSQHPAMAYSYCHYKFIKTDHPTSKLFKHLLHFLNKGKEYYHYTIEYFLHEAIKDIRRQHFDAIILENRPGFAMKLRKATQTKIIIHLENDFLNNEVAHHREIYDIASLLINTSSYITSRVKTINQHDTKSVTVLNGIDTQLFYDALPISRQEINMSDEDFIIVYSGRLTEEKGILELVKSLLCFQEIKNIKLLIIGASFYGKDKSSTPFMEELIKTAQPIIDSVRFTGFVNYKQIPSYLKAADLAVVPSMWEEPFGLTVVEAMAAGLPLITTRSGGIPEICEGAATIVNRAKIIEELYQSISDLYHHPEKRQAMSQASLERSTFFSKERYAKNYFDAIRTLV